MIDFGIIVEAAHDLYNKTGVNLSFVYDSYDRNLLKIGIAHTLQLVGACLIGSLVVGLIAAALCESRIGFVRRCARAYAEFFRNTPPLVQLFTLFFALSPLIPAALTEGRLAPFVSPFAWTVMTLSLYTGAFNAEAFRAGADAVPRSMLEAAETMCLSRGRILRYVTFPLALRFSLPSVTNNLAELIKVTTIASTIAVPETLYSAAFVWGDRGNVTELMVFLLIFYNVLVFALALASGALERRLRIPGFGS